MLELQYFSHKNEIRGHAASIQIRHAWFWDAESEIADGVQWQPVVPDWHRHQVRPVWGWRCLFDLMETILDSPEQCRRFELGLIFCWGIRYDFWAAPQCSGEREDAWIGSQNGGQDCCFPTDWWGFLDTNLVNEVAPVVSELLLEPWRPGQRGSRAGMPSKSLFQ